jgi:hypothetical protein
MGITSNVTDMWSEEDKLDYNDPVSILQKTVSPHCGIVNFLSENKRNQNQFSDWWNKVFCLGKRQA